MYLAHYGLKEKPFQISTDPRFLWLGEKHKEGLATLRYGVLDNRGFLLLTGDVGTGKTTLINALLNSLSDDVISATVPDPGLEKLDFFHFIANRFGLKERFQTKGEFLLRMDLFLSASFDANKKVILIIDEAQRTPPEILEEIRLLSNIERQTSKLINIFFVGQKEFNDALLRPENKALRQRITVNYHIDPLTARETSAYIRHRCRVAGASKELFEKRAVQKIYSFSGGFPRVINILCDHALLTGFVKGVAEINHSVVTECTRELSITKKTIGYQPPPQNRMLLQIAPGRKRSRAFAFGLTALLVVLLSYFFYTDGLRWLSSGVRSVGNAFFGPKKTAKVAPPPAVAGISRGGDPVRMAVAPFAGGDSAESVKPLSEYLGRKFMVYFERNSSSLPETEQVVLEDVAGVMQRHPRLNMVIRGYTDSSGAYQYNKRLSEFRADVVKSYFLGKGISQQRVTAIGMGPYTPSVDEADNLSPKAGRRIEIVLEQG